MPDTSTPRPSRPRLRPSAGWLAAALVLVLVSSASAAPRYQVFPTTGTYRGSSYPAAQLLERGLACTVRTDALLCFDTLAEAHAPAIAPAQPLPPPPPSQPPAYGPPTSPTHAAVSPCMPGLTVWRRRGFRGASLTFAMPGWWRLPPAFRHHVGSWRTGCRPGRLVVAEHGRRAVLTRRAGRGDRALARRWSMRVDAVVRGG